MYHEEGDFTQLLPCTLLLQLYIFHVATHPKFTWYTQCVDMWFISGPDERAWQEAYLILHAALLFFIPLAVIIVTYTIILVTINNNRRLCSGKQSRSHSEKISNSSSSLLLSSPPFHVPHPLDAYPYHVRLHANNADLKLNQITIFSCWIKLDPLLSLSVCCLWQNQICLVRKFSRSGNH